MDLSSFDESTRKNLEAWLSGDYDAATKAEINRLLKEDPKTLTDSFYRTLSFGTGGLRGLMGVGSNRMNSYTVGAATQGLANYLKKQKAERGKHTVIIGYDSRLHSKEFALHAASVLAANGIDVLIFDEIRPLPMVSFGCRHLKCTAGIMITASHNPPQYNGYKVFWDNGGQVLPPHDEGIIEEVNAITSPSQVLKTTLPNPHVTTLKGEIDKAYIDALRPLQVFPEDNQKEGKSLKIVYTSLHGTGITTTPKVLQDWGFSHVTLVPKQTIPDGTFPTCASPNPEEPAALQLGIHTLLETQSDLLIATDPDADRLGVVVRHQGEAVILNGNEIASICAEQLCENLKARGRLPEKGAFIKTIVTTELLTAIVESYHKHIENVLTGFKYIGEKIDAWNATPNGYRFIFGGEESYGYLYGTHARDKDAVISSALVCEIALHAKKEGKTLVDLLHAIYSKYGIYREKLISLTYAGKEGAEKMQRLMEGLRTKPPRSFAGIPVVAMEDYLTSQKLLFPTLKKEKLSLPSSDVLLFWLQDKSRLVVRPSGTEPKIKIYCGGKITQFSALEKGIAACDAHVEKLIESLKKHLA